MRPSINRRDSPSGRFVLELVDQSGDSLILEDGRASVIDGRPNPRLEVTLGAVEGDEATDLDVAAVRALREFCDEWLQESGA